MYVSTQGNDPQTEPTESAKSSGAHPAFDVHACGQLRIGTAGEQLELLPLADSLIPPSDGPRLASRALDDLTPKETHAMPIGCYCPDDCNCHHPHRPNYCGCRAHTAPPDAPCYHVNGGERSVDGWTCDDCGQFFPLGTVVEGQQR